MIPAAVIKLNKPHASFGQSPREQTVRSERSIRALRPVHVEHLLRLVRHVHQSRNAGLHFESHFVLADASGDFRVVDFVVVQLVDFLDGIDDVALPIDCHTSRTIQIKDGIARRTKLHTLKATRQKTAVPLP